MPSKLLTKTRYLNGLQCPKLLWVSINDKGRLPPVDPVTQHVFDQGHAVGELAKRLYPGGYDIPAGDFMGNIQETRRALTRRVPLFETGIMVGNLYARADILNPVGGNEWDIIEVKSSTSVKDVNYADVAFQRQCYRQAGLEIRNCYLAYINRDYVKHGEIDPQKFFIVEDISAEVEDLLPGVRDQIDSMLETMRAAGCPEALIGPHCNNPYDCDLRDECWGFLPDHSIFTLYYGGQKAFGLFADGVETIAEIPPDFKLNDKQRIQVEAVKSGETYLDQSEIRAFLETLIYPVYYLDFETFSPAVPLYDGMRPYQRVPFQFSLHVVAQPGGMPQHHAYLMPDREDPRPALLEALESRLGDRGSIVVYNQGFEQGVFRELAEAFPADAAWCEDVIGRMVDLLMPFRGFHYYNPAQKGSASMKKVLPALTGQGYADLTINEGELASVRFYATTFGDVPPAERLSVREALEVYCGQDTEGMIWIVDRLRALVDYA
jgi:hypothetical protein